MSAIEKLRALDQATLAVVEAAEDYKTANDGYGVGLHDQTESIEIALTRLRDTLSALKEALS